MALTSFTFQFQLFSQCELDVKTEKLFSQEAKVDSMKARIIELETEIATSQRQLW